MQNTHGPKAEGARCSLGGEAAPYQNPDPAANVAAVWLQARWGLSPSVAQLVASLAMLGARHV